MLSSKQLTTGEQVHWRQLKEILLTPQPTCSNELQIAKENQEPDLIWLGYLWVS